MPRSVYERFGKSALTGTDQSAARYTVKGGDTLPGIAAEVFQTGEYNSDAWRQLAEANGITDADDLTVGASLIIPTPKPTTT